MKRSKKRNKKLKIHFSVVLWLAICIGLLTLLAITGTINKSKQHNRQDAERKSDLSLIQAQLEAFRARTGYYPSLAQMNDANFRSSNLSQLTPATIQDPIWTSKSRSCSVGGSVIFQASNPAAGCYAYTPAPYGCTNQPGSICASYTLTANLSNDTIYSKPSIY